MDNSTSVKFKDGASFEFKTAIDTKLDALVFDSPKK